MPETRGNTPSDTQGLNPKTTLQPDLQGSPQSDTQASRRNHRRTHKRTHAATGRHKGATSLLAHNVDKPLIGVDDFMEMTCALHFSSYVPSPILDAGGMMIVAQSGSLKSSLLTAVSNLYPSKSICDSNWYFSKLTKLSGSFYNRSIRSIIIPELASLYVGDPRTAGRMEQVFQQMAGEGCFSLNDVDSRFARYEMRATIFGALTPEFAAKKHKQWEEGFHRRFLWAHLAMENDDILLDYLIRWKRLELEMSMPIAEPADGVIPDLLTEKEKRKIKDMLLDQAAFGPNHTRFVVFCKATSVLRWHYRRMKIKKEAMETARRFAGCLSDKAAILIIPHVEPLKGKS